jgi:hypothetical protein
MDMLGKKTKEEIKTLIHKIESCNSYLATLESIRDTLYAERKFYEPGKWADVQFNNTNKIAEVANELYKARDRLRKLGVY